MSNREQALRELIVQWSKDVKNYSDDSAKVVIRSCKRELEAALALPADAVPANAVGNRELALERALIALLALPRVDNSNLSSQVTVSQSASPSAVLTEEQHKAIIEWSAATKEYGEAPKPPTFSDARLAKAEKELHRLAILSAPAQPTAAKEGEK